MELTNSIRKQIASLNEAKHRKATGLFKAEGTKCVIDTIGSFRLRYLVATHQWLDSACPERYRSSDAVIAVSPSEMGRISSMTTPAPVVAVYEIPADDYEPGDAERELVLALDCVQDPGNLGTIIRTADWFGVRDIFCSSGCADVYSPKVVQATMGAISRVKLHYVDLPKYLKSLNGVPVYGTFLQGEDISKAKLTANGVIVMGNEGRGVSDEVSRLVNRRITIPPYPEGAITSESLNVATATSIIVSQFRFNL